MGLNELAYQIFSERMEEFATRNERIALKGMVVHGDDKSRFYRTVHDINKADVALRSQREGLAVRGGSQNAPKYKGAKDEGETWQTHEKVVSVPPTTSKLRAYLKYGDKFDERKARAIKEAKKHEGAHDRRRAYNEEHQKKYLANKAVNEKLKANGYI